MVVKQVPCKRAGCRGTCPEFVIMAGKKKGDPAICRVCGDTFKVAPGTAAHASYADAVKASSKAVAKAGGAQGKVLLARVEQLQKENAKLRSRPERNAPSATSTEQDDLAQAVASLDTLRTAQLQGADVTGAIQEQLGKVQRLRDAKLASKPAHAQLKQLDEQIGKKLKAIERFEAIAEEGYVQVRKAKEQSEEAKGELEKLKQQKHALSLVANVGVLAEAGDPLGQMAGFAAAVEAQLAGLTAHSAPRVAELQARFALLQEYLARLRAEEAADVGAPQAQRPADANVQPTTEAAPGAEVPAGMEAEPSEASEADEANAEWLCGRGLKREHAVDFVRASRPRHVACG